eukprot:107350-Chlamydomonas_euryale.AAC.10
MPEQTALRGLCLNAAGSFAPPLLATALVPHHLTGTPSMGANPAKAPCVSMQPGCVTTCVA